MTIENDLKRIADALEKIATHVCNPQQVVNPTQNAPIVPQEQTQAPPPPAADTPPPPAAETQAPPAQTLKSPEEMNTILVNEFKRIGDRAPIDQAMQSLGVTSVQSMTAEQQQQLITTVQAIASK